MGARSDWQSYPPSEAGEDDDEGEEGDETKSNGRAWTIYKEDAEASKKAKESADEHVHKYVQDQLKRLMSPDGPARTEDEIE